LGENKLVENENFDCGANAKFGVFTDFYSAYFGVSIFITVIPFFSVIMVVYPIVSLSRDYKDDRNENDQLREI
jgi:uncharacterized membrane protein